MAAVDAVPVGSCGVRRGSLFKVLAIGLLVGAAASAVAIFVPWLPEQASKERGRIDFVFWFTTAICIMIFSLVAAVSIYSYVKFRVRPDDDSDGPPVHGHTGLEIAWTAVPFVLVTAIAIVSAVVLAQNDRLPENRVTVDVTAQQFAWSFTYPEFRGVTSSTLRLPVDRAAELRLRARDVIHSFFVPEFGQKQDAVPGLVTRLVITPTRTGEFPLACYELCGLGHAAMRTRAIVMTQDEFDGWVRQQRQALARPAGEAGASVFAENGCGSCHTFTAARSRASAGPNLDRLPAQARRAGKPLEEFVRESIVKPDAYIERGFSDVMPKTYSQLPEDQLDALVQYLVRESREGR